MANTLSINDNIKAEELKTKLQDANLSEKQIQEVLPVILNSLKEIRDLKKERTKTATQKNLKDLGQSITNQNNIENKNHVKSTSNATVNIERDNNGNVIGNVTNTDITTANITNNNTNITINLNLTKTETQVQTTPKTVTLPPIEPKTETQTSIAPKTITQTPKQLIQNNRIINNTLDVHTLVGFLTMIDKLLREIEDTKKGISKKNLSKAGKKGMDDAKEKLTQYEKVLKGKKEGLQKQNRAEISDNDIEHLKNLQQQINKVREDIGMSQRGEYSSTASYLYNSPEVAKTSNKHQIDSLEFNQKLQEETKKGAILNIFNRNVQTANDYFRKIAQGEYTYADYEFFTSNAAVLTPSFQNCGINIPIWPKNIQTNGGVEYALGSSRSVDYTNMDLMETFQNGGIAGILEKGLNNCKNMTPGQRDTWKNLGVLGCVAGLLYGGYKFFTTEKLKLWQKAGITAATILGSQIATGEGPISLISKILTGGRTKEYIESKFGGGIFGEAVNGVGNSGIEESKTIIPSMYLMMIFNPTTTVGDIHNLTSTFKTDGDAWINFRQQAIDKLKTGNYGNACIERFSATFSDNFDEEKRKERLASMGISDSTDNQKTVYEISNNSTFNEVALNKYKSENGLKETSNKAKREELHNYINNLKNTNQAVDIDILNGHPEWFELDKNATYTEKPEDIQFKENLANQIESLPINDQKKVELKTAVKRFYDERTINTKPKLSDFSLKMESGFLTLTSHSGEKAKIDINKGEIVGFGNGIRFASLADLLNTADLANEVLDTQKGKVPKDMPPFQYKKIRKGICFNDASSVREDLITRNNTGMDTRVLSTGRGGATSKIDTLYNHPEEFADYLSNRRIETNQLKMNLFAYPTIKKLSELGIIFTNEQEVKQAENRLNKIKELRSFSNKGTQGYKPFSIEGNKLVFSTSDTKNPTKLYFPDEFPNNFSGKSLDLSDFPTILDNKTTFLNYMNNNKNGMRGSKLNQ